MTLSDLQQKLKDRIRSAASEVFGVEIDQLNADTPPKPELGDLAFPVSFELAKLVKQKTGEKQNPRAIAELLKVRIEDVDEVARVEIAGAGYINVFFDRAKLLSAVARPEPTPPLAEDRPKKMVEHTSINPNKAAHIGHVRNAVLGDTFVRILQAAGDRVEVQNYIDNTGVQVADVVVGFMELEKKDLHQIRELDASLTKEYTFDYYCWDLYTKVGLFYRDGNPSGDINPIKAKLRTDVLHSIEAGDNSVAELADYVATRNVACILDTMERLGIRYDLLARESDILHLHFWERAFTLMKETGVIRYETEGRHAGCWVMPFESHTGTDEHESDKIIVRSNGTVTYTGKDIAYQLWKLGKLGLDFHYNVFRTYPDGQLLWVTTTDADAEAKAGGGNPSGRPHFGGGVTVYNVIDSRQSYPQDIVARGVAAVVPEIGDDASVHFSYEMVALSPAACDELGIELTDEDRARPYIEMSGRKGLGVRADDLVDALLDRARGEVRKRNGDLSEDAIGEIARRLAVGALRYYMLRFTKNRVVAFDVEDSLAFEGETGPYLQYAAVRSRNIFHKLEEREGFPRSRADEVLERARFDIMDPADAIEHWKIVREIARLPEIVRQAVDTLELSTLARFAFSVSQMYSTFYHRHSILNETDPARRDLRIALNELYLRFMETCFSLMGIPLPERM